MVVAAHVLLHLGRGVARMFHGDICVEVQSGRLCGHGSYSAVYNQSELSIRMTICGNTDTLDTQTGQITEGYNDLGGNVIQAECPVPTCPADFDGDDMIDASDLGRLLSEWTANDPCQDAACLAADLNDDGRVDAQDLTILLGVWGACQ